MTKCTGIDISKQTFDCSITAADGKIENRKFSNNKSGFEKLLKLLAEDSHVIMEASGPYYYKLAYFLFEKNISISVVNPLVIRRFCQMRMIRTKTDKKDAQMIREYGITERPGLWKPDKPSITKLKQLNSSIELMEKNTGALRNQLEAFEHMPDADKQLVSQLKKIINGNEKAKEKMEQELNKTVIDNFKTSYEVLQSIPGIGPKSAALLIAVTGNFEKFNHYKELIAYVGLNPRIFESGTSVKGRGSISKMGTGRLRKFLYLCTWTAKKVNPYCREMYARLKAKAKPEKVIKIALACKLLRQAFALGRGQKKFEINYQPTIAN